MVVKYKINVLLTIDMFVLFLDPILVWFGSVLSPMLQPI